MHRARATTHPPVPNDLDELHTSLTDPRYAEKYGTCPDGSLMTRGLVGPEGHQSLIMTSNVMLNVLVAAVWLFVDGTFSVRPQTPSSRQLLVITALYQGSLFPVCFVLMSSKAEVAYRALFSFLKDLAPNLSPGYIVTDFEAALVAPIRDLFPDTSHQGCWFHFCQALHRMVGSLGLIVFVKESYNAQLIIRMCYVLPLLPAAAMIEGLNAIEYTSHLNGLLELNPYFDYIRQTWMHSVGPDFLTVHRSKHRTNNFVESYHKTLQDKIQTRRPGVWDFVKAINSELCQAHTDMILVQSSQPTRRNRKPKWFRQDAKIRRWQDEFNRGEITVLQFLMKAQNTTKSLLRTQFHLPENPLPSDETNNYPVQLAASNDLDEEQADAPSNDDNEASGSEVASQDLFATQNDGAAGVAVAINPTPLLMPPGHLSFTNRILPETVDVPRQQPMAHSPPSPPQEPDASPRNGRRLRPPLARQVEAVAAPQLTQGSRGRRAGRRGGSRGARRTQRRRDEAIADAPLREEQHRVQQEAVVAAQRHAQEAAGTASGDCVICMSAERTHAAIPAGTA